MATPAMQPREFEIIAEVGQGISLPSDKKYNVKIKIGDFELKTEKPQFAENTYNRWNHRFPKASYSASYLDISDIGKVYFYLMDANDNPICYYKDSIQNYLDPNPKMKWLEMTPDLSIGKVKEHHKAGLISVKLTIHDKTANGSIEFSKYNAWKKPPPKRLNIYKIRAFVF